jgi:UPF0755 protein
MTEREQYEAYRKGPRWNLEWLKWVAVAGLVIATLVIGVFGMRWLAGTVSDAIGADDGPVIEPGVAVEVEVPSGASAAEIARLLSEAGVVDSAIEFERHVRNTGMSNRLIAGRYDLTTGMGVEEAAAALSEGPAEGDVFRITVIEGLTVNQMLDSIARQTEFTFAEMSAALLDGSVTSSLLPRPVDELADWEGLLFPDTYEFASNVRPSEILETLAATAEARVASVDWSDLEARGLTTYEGVIIASMIEREAAIDDERPIIASVIFNRLDADMLLQIDATVVYALGGGSRVLTLDDLEVESPYNTYLNPGLPPTPIAGPRLASLRAAAGPAETDYLYYVLADSDGNHAFTADFDEFLEFQQQAREDGIIP